MCSWMCHGLATERPNLHLKFRRCKKKPNLRGPVAPLSGSGSTGMSSLIATVTTYACSACGKGFGTYSSCCKHARSGRVNQCRDRGATVLPVTTLVSRHDRNVAGRHAAPIPHADRDSEDVLYDRESDTEPGPADPASESGYPHISKNVS